MKVLILGAPELAGNSGLEQALTHPLVTEAVAPTRENVRALSQ